jgi:hypothetical protein
MIYGDFPSIPLILVITLQNRKPQFYVFLRFKNLPELKLTWDFSGVNILSREPSRRQEVNNVGHNGKRAQVARAPGQAVPPIPVWATRLRCCPSLSPNTQLNLKTPI